MPVDSAACIANVDYLIKAQPFCYEIRTDGFILGAERKIYNPLGRWRQFLLSLWRPVRCKSPWSRVRGGGVPLLLWNSSSACCNGNSTTLALEHEHVGCSMNERGILFPEHVLVFMNGSPWHGLAYLAPKCSTYLAQSEMKPDHLRLTWAIKNHQTMISCSNCPCRTSKKQGFCFVLINIQ